MRALKSILGSSLIDEKTSLGGRMVPLAEVVEIFVRHLKHKAEAFAGQEITSVVHGRPVRFVDGDDAGRCEGAGSARGHRQAGGLSRHRLRLRADRRGPPL